MKIVSKSNICCLVETQQTSNQTDSLNINGYKCFSLFLDMCKSLPLRILNGRFLGDLFGNFTCFTPRGASSVDYGAVSPALLKQVRHFLVSSPCLHLSDHTPIQLCLQVNAVHVPVFPSNSTEMFPKPNKVTWDKNLAEKYTNLLNSPNCKDTLSGFLNTGVLPNQTSVERRLSSDTQLVHDKKYDGNYNNVVLQI